VRIGRVVGQITLNRSYHKMRGSRLLIVKPHTIEVVRDGAAEPLETIIVWDELSATDGDTVGFSEGREGACPFHPDKVPVDAYLSCILDAVNVVDAGSK
jgi:microcompartment protein CcmK/EutM